MQPERTYASYTAGQWTGRDRRPTIGDAFGRILPRCARCPDRDDSLTPQALKYLASLPFVRADRVGVLGMSMGGWSVLFALQRDMLAPKFPQKFRAGVALYPQCRAMVAGEAESGTYAPPYGKPPSGDRSMLELVVYPDTYHSFDAANLRFGDGVRFLGHFLQYNDAATRDSVERVRTFLGRTLAD